MKKFTFKLAALLKYRKLKEDEAKNKLAAALKVLSDCKAELHDIEQSIFCWQQQVNEVISAGTTVNILLTYNDQRSFLKIQKNQILKQLETATANYRQALTELQEKMQQRKLVDKMYDKEYIKYCELALKEEQKLLDEIALKAGSQGKDNHA